MDTTMLDESAQWAQWNFRNDDGSPLAIHNLHLLLAKLQVAQENLKLSPVVNNLMAARELTLTSTQKLPSRLGEPLPNEDEEQLDMEETRREVPNPVQPQHLANANASKEDKRKERSPSPLPERKRGRSQERTSRRRKFSSEDSSSTSSGRSSHGRFPRRKRQPPPSPPTTPPSQSESSNNEDSKKEVDSSLKRHKKNNHAKKKKKKSKRGERFKEGSKNISFVTYVGTYGAIDKVLAFVQ